MNRFIQSVGTQLSLALLLVVAVALGVVYLTVVPSLRNRAINTRVTGIEKIANKLRPQVDLGWAEDNGVVATQSEENGGVRIALMQPPSPQGTIAPITDSGQVGSALFGDPIASRAYISGGKAHGTVRTGETTYAEAAVPVLGGSYVLLVRAPVELGSIALVERRVILAAGVA
ncbi:MAG TPA: hypothetical protein VFK62_10185, partial [Gaiellaceae bacterium]|nr:hypothetical protein [Gaiellaceae bacterium]